MRFPLPGVLDEFRRRTPTTDLYVLNPLRHLTKTEPALSLPRVTHLFGNVYAVGDTCIISRTAAGEQLGQIAGRPFRQIVYVVDDDFEAGAADPLVPAAYRAKLAAFAEGPLREIRAMADVVVASSPPLAAAYGPKAVLMHPAWRRSPAALDHFDRKPSFEIAHLGTGSHAGDLLPLGAELERVLTEHRHVRLTIFAAAACPEKLRGHAQVRLLRAAAWWRYRLTVPMRRFHLAIYPLHEGPFSAARSANKLFEHALVGAASLMTPIPALTHAAGPGLVDLFVEGGLDAWGERIRADIADREAGRERAVRTGDHIRELDPLARAARQWRAILSGAAA
jgi:hypothetical protein